MKLKSFLLLIAVTLVLAACGRGPEAETSAPPQPTATSVETQPTAPADTPAVATAVATEPPVAPPTSTSEPPATAPASDTPAPSATAPRPRATATPVSIGPLDFQFYMAGCRRAPTAEKPGNVFITISVEATGGNGVYRYVREGVDLPGKFFDVEIELGTSINGKVTVVSGDGQTLEKEFFFSTNNIECT